MYGQEDNARGVWKSPAGIETALLGTTGVDPNGVMTDLQQGVLNENALNCLRQFPGIGTVVFGARTTAAADHHLAAAVEVRGGAAHGAVHRADPLRQPHLGGLRGERHTRCGTP